MKNFFGRLENSENGLNSWNIQCSLDILAIRALYGTCCFVVQFPGSQPRLIAPPVKDSARAASDENSFSFLCTVFIFIALAYWRTPDNLEKILNAIEKVRGDDFEHVSMGDLQFFLNLMIHPGEEELREKIIAGLSIFSPIARPSCNELKNCIENCFPSHPVGFHPLQLGGFRIFHVENEQNIALELRETFDMMLVRWLYSKRSVFISVEEHGWVELLPRASDSFLGATEDQSFCFLSAMCLVLILVSHRAPDCFPDYVSFFRASCVENLPQPPSEAALPSIPFLLDPTGIAAVQSALSAVPSDRPRSHELLELIKPNFKTVLFA